MTYRPRIRDLVLDKHSAIPLYLQLKHHILHLISSGEWKPGMPLPSVRQLASELGMATATVQRTYGELQSQGMLVGQAGRGVYVADLSVGVPSTTLSAERALATERQSVLHGLLARAILHARSLGYDEDEILATVRGLAGEPSHASSTLVPRLVFIGGSDDVVAKYHSLLRDALDDLGVPVDTVLIGEIEERGDAALDEREPIRCLVSLVGSFADLRRLAGHRGTPLFGLVVDLTIDTQQRLVALPDDVVIGLVADERYLPSARAVMRQYLGGEERLRFATLENPTAVRRLLRSTSIIVHTLGARRLVESLAAPTTQMLELQFRPNPSSIARLRSLLGVEGATLRNGHTVATGNAV